MTGVTVSDSVTPLPTELGLAPCFCWLRCRRQRKMLLLTACLSGASAATCGLMAAGNRECCLAKFIVPAEPRPRQWPCSPGADRGRGHRRAFLGSGRAEEAVGGRQGAACLFQGCLFNLGTASRLGLRGSPEQRMAGVGCRPFALIVAAVVPFAVV